MCGGTSVPGTRVPHPGCSGRRIVGGTGGCNRRLSAAAEHPACMHVRMTGDGQRIRAPLSQACVRLAAPVVHSGAALIGNRPALAAAPGRSAR